ncbi:MAG: hypothetical protein EXR98_01135 [Gemmataceae bacterium]|nr:hypothetical protein [Gemmataceae bacterium]
MNKLLRICFFSACLWLAAASARPAQQPQLPPAVPQPEPAKTDEAKKSEQTSGPSPVVPYMLAAIGTIIVMVLVCVPARRG